MVEIIMKWLRKHPFEAHLIAFVLMLAPSFSMYLAAQSGALNWVVVLVGLVILGNLLELAIK